jgi:hypothetical protein
MRWYSRRNIRYLLLLLLLVVLLVRVYVMIFIPTTNMKRYQSDGVDENPQSPPEGPIPPTTILNIQQQLQQQQQVVDTEPIPIESTPSKKYLLFIPKHSEGLNNYLLSVNAVCGMSKMLNRMLLMHPYPQNGHVKKIGFTVKDFMGAAYPGQYRFDEIFDLNVPHEYIDSFPEILKLGKKSKEKAECRAPSGESNIKTAELTRRVTNCLNTNTNTKYLMVIRPFRLDKFLPRSVREECWSINSSIYDIVRNVLAERNIKSSIVVHLRLGDFKLHCARRKYKNCFIPPSQVLPGVRKFQLKHNIDKVILITNEPGNGEVRRQLAKYGPSWSVSNTIIHNSNVVPDRAKKDGTVRVILDMVFGILADHFFGNIKSTLSMNIIRQRRAQNKKVHLLKYTIPSQIVKPPPQVKLPAKPASGTVQQQIQQPAQIPEQQQEQQQPEQQQQEPAQQQVQQQQDHQE